MNILSRNGHKNEDSTADLQFPFEIIKQKNVDRFRCGISTLKPFKDFDGHQDALKIVEAFKSHKETIVLQILAKRTAVQRREIAEYYFKEKGSRLIKELKHQYESRFFILMSGLSIPYYEFLARSIHHSLHFKWLYYILFTIPQSEIKFMKEYFSHKYKQSAESFINRKLKRDDCSTWRYLNQPLHDMLNEIRDETDIVNEKDVEFDILQLHLLVGGNKILGDDDGDDSDQSEKEILKEIFFKRNFEHLKRVCERYTIKNQAKSLHLLLKKISPTNNIYNHLVDFAMNKDYYFARILKKSFDGYSHDCYLLTHLFISRAEIDLFDIMKQFEVCQGKRFVHILKEKTSGSYKDALLHLMDEEDNMY